MGAAVIMGALVISHARAAPGNGNNRTEALPTKPVASFSASPSVVQTGTIPTLRWTIIYPSRVGDVATITPPGTITLTEPMFVQVRAVGVGVTSNLNGGQSSDAPAETRISVNGSSYQQLFYGNNSDVDPAHSLYVKKHNAGTVLNFGGRYVRDYQWTPFYSTRSANMQVIALVDGDSIPTSYDLNQSGRMAEYLKPYVDSTGKVDIGPLSILVLGEYGTSTHSSPSFDYQDFVLLVNLSTKNNNGHGNNIDGVDASNPGQGTGGPNGGEDPSAGVDDEGSP